VREASLKRGGRVEAVSLYTRCFIFSAFRWTAQTVVAFTTTSALETWEPFLIGPAALRGPQRGGIAKRELRKRLDLCRHGSSYFHPMRMCSRESPMMRGLAIIGEENGPADRAAAGVDFDVRWRFKANACGQGY